MLDELKTGKKTVGVKETHKALKDGRVRMLFVANDADKRLTDPVVILCKELNIAVYEAKSMKELGSLCGIDVGAAVAGLL